jgi:hypothetical protein
MSFITFTLPPSIIRMIKSRRMKYIPRMGEKRNAYTIKDKGIPVTGREGPYSCERLRLPYYLVKRLIDGGNVVRPTRQPLFLKIPGTHFC